MASIDGGEFKAVTVAKLREILAALPDDALVMTNPMGNIGITSPDFSQWLGFIDLLTEAWVPDDVESEDVT